VQGLGNDFILVDNRGSPQPVLTPEQVRARACGARQPSAMASAAQP
jgi:hypothetical protein